MVNADQFRRKTSSFMSEPSETFTRKHVACECAKTQDVESGFPVRSVGFPKGWWLIEPTNLPFPLDALGPS